MLATQQVAGEMDHIAQDRVLVFALVVLSFTVKQFVADFPLQTRWMARGKEHPTNFLYPLATHAAIHGSLSTIIAMTAAPSLWWLGTVDFAVHFVIDFARVVLNRRAKWETSQAAFWNLFGLDQMMHQLTGLALAVVLVGSG